MTPKNKFDGYRKYGPDSKIEGRIASHCKKFKLDPLDAVKLFPLLARRQWLKRFMAHHELFLKTLEVPGDIAELGVFRGVGLMTWANLLESYCIGSRTKVVFGFDNWKGFVDLASEDGKEVGAVQKVVGGFSPELHFKQLKDAISIFDEDRFVPWKNRIRLIEGNIEDSAPAFTQQHPGVRFSLVHFDCDLYKPTKAALQSFWPRLCRGGVMIFDEYAIADWPGETQAVDEFFADMPNMRIRTFPWTNSPGGYLIKE
ncbi:MAG: class I SAM-dependent methyltransferase [Elusimicrobia bacterium]|nr:class I SAM-dependent methyltransferase [Elusimicrobiota bacterium]